MPHPALKRLLLPGLLLLGFLARLGYGLSHPPQGPGQPLASPDGYVELASSWADTGTLKLGGQPSAWREPAYPLLLGALFKAFGRSYAVVLLTNCSLAVIALAFLALAGRDLFGEAVALTAAAVGALYPPFIYYAAQGVRETALLAAGATLLWALLRALRRPSRSAFAGAGLAGALCGLTNVTSLPFALVLAPLAILALRRRGSGAYLAAFLLLYSFWPLRNYLTFRAWIPGTTLPAGGILYNYLIVPQELGGTPEEARLRQADAVYQATASMSPEQAERTYRRESLRWIARHPGAYLKVFCWRFFWDEWRLWPRPQAAGGAYRRLRLLGLLTDGWIIPLGLVGLALGLRRERLALCPALFILSIVLTHSLIMTMLRYRLPIMPWLILFASLTLCRLWEALRGRT